MPVHPIASVDLGKSRCRITISGDGGRVER
ncbi:MAG: hypothetical protein K0Q52_3622, partial [Microbacterium sp.]|nr:hypothetical protein [Microbacterium sp.]